MKDLIKTKKSKYFHEQFCCELSQLHVNHNNNSQEQMTSPVNCF